MPALVRARVAIHVHSDWSYDGSWTLPAIARTFSAASVTSRSSWPSTTATSTKPASVPLEETCARASTETLALVPSGYSDPANTVSRPTVGRSPYTGRRTRDVPRSSIACQSVGGLAVLAHLSRRGVVKRFTPEWSCPNCSGSASGIASTTAMPPTASPPTCCGSIPSCSTVASLDFHTARHFHPLAMIYSWTKGFAPKRVIDALGHRRARPTAYRLPAANFAHGPVWPGNSAVTRAQRRSRPRAAGQGELQPAAA